MVFIGEPIKPSSLSTFHSTESRHFSGTAVAKGEKANCDWIYGNQSKSHIRSYEIIDFKDFNAL